MKHKTVVTITGIRPDFIRMSEVFKKLDVSFNHILIHSGQHYDRMLSDIFFEDLNIRQPDYNLRVGNEGKKHYVQQAELGIKLIELFKEKNIKPNIILFLGDSNSVLASVPLRKEGYKIGHIEAGMRSYDERMFEEINRKVCDHVSNMLLVYHQNYKQKAMREGISEDRIFVVGNTIVEPLRKIADFSYKGTKKHILLDIHRPENFNCSKRLQSILDFANLCKRKTNTPVKMLKFGRTMTAINNFDLNLNNIETMELMGYKTFVRMMQDSLFIISDSGTAQEEPALLKIPVIAPRDFTERPESVQNGNSIMLNVLDKECYNGCIEWAAKTVPGNSAWLGDGTASRQIVRVLEENL